MGHGQHAGDLTAAVDLLRGWDIDLLDPKVPLRRDPVVGQF